MKEYLGDIGYEIIDSMTVLSASMIGDEPENEIMKIMNNLTKAYQIDVLRTFGFDIPIEKDHKHTTLRGYEYWLSVDMIELNKLPGDDTFEFEGINVFIKEISACRYAKLRIENPFSDPFERIGVGWRRLLSWLERHDFKDSGIVKSDNAYCLEEIKESDGIIVMDIYVPVARVKVQ